MTKAPSRRALQLPKLAPDEAADALRQPRLFGLHAAPGRPWAGLLAELERIAGHPVPGDTKRGSRTDGAEA